MMDTMRAFFLKSGYYCGFSKKTGSASPLLPSCTPASKAKYALISLNMPKYPKKMLE